MAAPKRNTLTCRDKHKIGELLTNIPDLSVEQARTHVKAELGIETTDSDMREIGEGVDYEFQAVRSPNPLNDMAVLADAILHILAQSGIELTPTLHEALEKISTHLEPLEQPKETNK